MLVQAIPDLGSLLISFEVIHILPVPVDGGLVGTVGSVAVGEGRIGVFVGGRAVAVGATAVGVGATGVSVGWMVVGTGLGVDCGSTGVLVGSIRAAVNIDLACPGVNIPNIMESAIIILIVLKSGLFIGFSLFASVET
jgi:hypothetical protein